MRNNDETKYFLLVNLALVMAGAVMLWPVQTRAMDEGGPTAT